MTPAFREQALSLPGGFELWQRLVGAPRSKQRFVAEHVQAQPGDRVLDLGCGTGALLEYLPSGVAYLGVDASNSYIDRARRRWLERGDFVRADITTYRPAELYDIVIAYGVLHHLDDHQVGQTLELAREALAKHGRALFAEPCRRTGQGIIESALMNHDRGHHIRTADHYAELARDSFAEVTADVVPGTYRVPFTLALIRAAVPR
jgi:cyclopropane fatty-acyl-phospholipid synthase-like methyltransferase